MANNVSMTTIIIIIIIIIIVLNTAFPSQLWMVVRPMTGKSADVVFGLAYTAVVIASFPGTVLVCRYFHLPVLLRTAFATEQVSA